MGPESSRVKVKDLAQAGLILMTIFEAELCAITFRCAPRTANSHPTGTTPRPLIGCSASRLRDQIYQVENSPFHRITDRSCAQEERERDQRNVGRDRVADRVKKVAGLEVIHDQRRVKGGERGVQRI